MFSKPDAKKKKSAINVYATYTLLLLYMRKICRSCSKALDLKGLVSCHGILDNWTSCLLQKHPVLKQIKSNPNGLISANLNQCNEGWVCRHTDAFAIYILKVYLKAKEEELWKLKNSSPLYFNQNRDHASWFTATGDDALSKLEGIESSSQQQQHND
jgi:hypothetical protein